MTTTFQANEKVLCYHGPLIYQAKVLKAEIWTGTDPSEGGFTGPHYFVHYQGWKASWDEWVPESRVLKFNDENITRQKALILAAQNKGKEKEQERQAAAAAASAAASSSAGGGSKDSGSSRKRPRDSDEKGRRGGSAGLAGAGGASASKRGRDAVGDEEEFLRRPEIKIVIPDALKVQLVDDWGNVTKYDQLVPLPKKPNVKDVLKMYRDHVLEERKKRESKSSKDSKDGASGSSSGSSRLLTQPLAVLDEVLSGLELYFDKALGNNLLYRFERTQYLQISKGAAAAMTGRKRVGAGGSGEEGKSKREVTPTGGQEAEEKQPSEIYGAEHLLRLFVNLPSIIAHTTLDADSVVILREHLDDFLAFMVKEKPKLFASKYEVASPAYHRVSLV